MKLFFIYLCMEIKYKSNKLARSVDSPRSIQKNYGTRAKLVNQRLKELQAAPTLEIMRTIPAANCHELSGGQKNELAVDISANHRIIFEPNHRPKPVRADGGLDWSQVSSIIVNAIGEDYH